MKNGAIVLGIAMLVGGLVALYMGITAMTVEPCFIGENCAATDGSRIILFPVGLTLVILGSIVWTAAVGQLNATGSSKSPLQVVGFFGIFGLTFFGIGAVMFLADRAPNADHTTNVLTILGIIFGIVGILSLGAEIVFRFAGAANERILATGIRGRATVTAVRDANVTVNENPMVALDLRVEIPGQPVFTRTVRQVVSRLDVGQYRPGMILAVAADPAKPRDIAIDWDQSPIGDANAALDPVTGRPMAPGSAAVTVAPGVSYATGGGLSGPELAAILRAAADQVAAGGDVAHPGVATVVTTSHGWSSTGQALPNADMAEILRSAASRVESGGTTRTSGGLSNAELASLLRQASDEVARSSASSGALGPGQSGTSGPSGVGTSGPDALPGPGSPNG